MEWNSTVTVNEYTYKSRGNLLPYVAGAIVTNTIFKHYKKTPPMLRAIHPAWTWIAWGALALAFSFDPVAVRVNKEH
jgi:hypothetical protein